MKQSGLYLIEFLFVDVAAIAWAAWEYWSIRPKKTDQGGPADGASPEPRVSPEDSGHAKR